MKKQLTLLKLSLITVSLLLIISCKKGEENFSPSSPTINTIIPQNNYTPPAVTFKAPVQGFVVDADGNTISGAEVKTGNKTATTDINGYFRIENADFTGDFCYIKATKNGFFTASTTVHGVEGKSYAANLVLTQPEQTKTFNTANGASINLQNGAKIELPANGYVTSANTTYTGNVTAWVKHINPEADNYGDLIPGGDLRAYDAAGNDRILYSFGMLNIELHDDRGNLLQLAEGKEATLTIPVGTSQQAEAPNTIPLWYFDEYKGVWIEEGEAILQGNTYTGKVSHFTPWNCDKPFPPSIITGKVVDGKGEPINTALVWAGGKKITTTADGRFKVLVIANEEEKLDLINVENEERIGIDKMVTASGEGQTLDVGALTMPDASKVTAVVKKCDGSAFNGYAVLDYENGFKRRVLVDNSTLAFTTFSTGKQVRLAIYSSDKKSYTEKTITLPATNDEVKTLGEIKVCDDTEGLAFFEFTYIEAGKAPVHIKEIIPLHAEFIYFKSQEPSSTTTNIQFSDGLHGSSDRTYFFAIAFGEKRAGKFTLSNATVPDSEGLLSYRLIDKTTGNTTYNITSYSVEMNMDNYGEVGETITGKFAGYARVLASPQRDVTIKNGSFRVVRVPDK
jgi:hypothetical protein